MVNFMIFNFIEFERHSFSDMCRLSGTSLFGPQDLTVFKSERTGRGPLMAGWLVSVIRIVLCWSMLLYHKWLHAFRSESNYNDLIILNFVLSC